MKKKLALFFLLGYILSMEREQPLSKPEHNMTTLNNSTTTLNTYTVSYDWECDEHIEASSEEEALEEYINSWPSHCPEADIRARAVVTLATL